MSLDLKVLSGGLPSESTEGAAAERLRSALVPRARERGLLDVAYRVVDSPFGDLLVAATPAGLVRVAFSSEGHGEVLESLALLLSPRLLYAPALLDEVARELSEYFEGRRREFGITVDLALSLGFRRQVLQRLRGVAYGRTVSYGALAAEVGSPRAARAVGSACATNPVPVVVPCHRVVRSDGSVGRYSGPPGVKERLLALEAGDER